MTELAMFLMVFAAVGLFCVMAWAILRLGDRVEALERNAGWRGWPGDPLPRDKPGAIIPMSERELRDFQRTGSLPK